MMIASHVLTPSRLVPLFAFVVAALIGVGWWMSNQQPPGGWGPPPNQNPQNPQNPPQNPQNPYGPQVPQYPQGYGQPAPHTHNQIPLKREVRSSSGCDGCDGCDNITCGDCVECAICDLDCLSNCESIALRGNLVHFAPSALILLAPLIILSMWRRRLLRVA
jgi:hypothetical protein